VDRAGPFRLFAVEVVTAVHAILLGLSIIAYAFATRASTHSPRAAGSSAFRPSSAQNYNDTSDYADKPLGLGIPIVDVALMALLDVVNLILVFLTGIYVPPTLTVILVQFLIPLTVFLTQALPGRGGLSPNHLWGSLIILVAVVLVMFPALYSIADPNFFVYADPIPLRTAYNSLLFLSASVPAAASQLYKEHVFLYYKQPANLPLLNLLLSIFQFLFSSLLLPLVFGLQGLGAKTNEDWSTLYPSKGERRCFVFVFKLLLCSLLSPFFAYFLCILEYLRFLAELP
jgi:hypothetical protein